jgi:hypothetical protein
MLELLYVWLKVAALPDGGDEVFKVFALVEAISCPGD